MTVYTVDDIKHKTINSLIDENERFTIQESYDYEYSGDDYIENKIAVLSERSYRN